MLPFVRTGLRLTTLPLELRHLCHHSSYASVYGLSWEDPEPGLWQIASDYVVKTCRLDASATERAGFCNMANALLEQRVAQPLAFEHPNLAPLWILFNNNRARSDDEPMPVLVTPRYRNIDILTFCALEPPKNRLSLILQIAQAILHLHDHDVVYGNIHPGNVVVTDDYDIVLTDIAVHTEACRHILLPHAATIPLEQSCLYQAPEILNPEADLDEVGLSSKPSDVYAFACTVLAILTGSPPIYDKFRCMKRAMAEVLFHGHLRIARPPQELISNDLWDLLQSCWDWDPTSRPSMTEIVKILKANQTLN